LSIYYSTGTVTVNNGSASVTGVGTGWLANGIRPGDWLIVRNQIAVIATVDSATALTLVSPWIPATAAGAAYSIVRVDDGIRALQVANDLLATFQAGPANGRFGDGSAATPGIGFSAQTNTGFYRPGASVAALAVNGVERMRWTATGAQLTGLLTGTAVTQSVDDTTAGRLLKVGDFGLGQPGNAGTLLSAAGAADALRGWRIDRVSGANVALVGGPAGAAGGTFETIGYSADNQHQLYFEVSGGGRVFQRFFNAGVWSPWRNVYTTGNILGTVSQTGGVPTGAVIQSGSGANGEFVRFANGTQICTHALETTTSGAVPWTFPAAFAASPRVHGSPQGAAVLIVSFNGNSSTLVNVNAFTSAGARATNPVLLTATGRWFI
jgi:hypothetical protein